MTPMAAASQGGGRIEHTDALRSAGTASVLNCVVKAPATPAITGQVRGNFLHSLLWGHVRQWPEPAFPGVPFACGV